MINFDWFCKILGDDLSRTSVFLHYTFSTLKTLSPRLFETMLKNNLVIAASECKRQRSCTVFNIVRLRFPVKLTKINTFKLLHIITLKGS